MLNKKVQIGLNQQLNREFYSSQLYLIMASFVERKGFDGVCQFLYNHSNEERLHMIKLIRYINKRGGNTEINHSILFRKIHRNTSLEEIFLILFEQEIEISKEIDYLVELTMNEKDYATHHFLQWYVKEQIEEEEISKKNLDKIKLLGSNKFGLYLFNENIRNIVEKKET
ncbi:ferritin [Blattabacterium cuenoti]|uniref:ferritin n=1 Tax=Blattabacterium cuenoti TaxID=1653831 RepID=UPI00163CC1A9|nr:ferritin [Blattabacterium cuenoti]